MIRFYIALLILSAVFLIIDIYAFQALKTVTKNKNIHWTWMLFSIFTYGQFFYTLYTKSPRDGQTIQFQYSFGLLLLFIIPKAVLLATLLSEDVYRVCVKIFRATSASEIKTLPSRRKFISQLALGLAAIPFASFLYGFIKGKYNFKVLKYELSFIDLPEAFDGFTITQISDIHAGSFVDTEKVQYALNLVNEQNSDLLLFTGDIVNNRAEEMDPFLQMFANLKAPFGKFSILGNHDYGDYIDWGDDKKAKAANFEAIKNIHPKIGFDLLMNENRTITKDDQQIRLIGLENWGKGWKKAGDLKKSSENINAEEFKIVMSHDPSHWEYEIKNNDLNYQLTLSGHTHGLQLGIEIPGFIKWSPSSFIYKQWAGIYENIGRFINVNRGFGFHGFAGRVGIWPEITVIKLKKGKVTQNA